MAVFCETGAARQGRRWPGSWSGRTLSLPSEHVESSPSACTVVELIDRHGDRYYTELA